MYVSNGVVVAEVSRCCISYALNRRVVLSCHRQGACCASTAALVLSHPRFAAFNIEMFARSASTADAPQTETMR